MITKEDEAARASVNEKRFAEGMERAREMEETAEYAAFVEKFVPKKTTDECYTPRVVYDAVKEWAVERYDMQGREIVRPFYPGGDYERADYPEGCVVIDNPPFSMLSKICAFYQKKKLNSSCSRRRKRCFRWEAENTSTCVATRKSRMKTARVSTRDL